MSKIQFDEARHLYTVGDEIVPSVTFVLRQTGVSPDSRYYSRQARDRGRAVHEAIRLFDENRLNFATLDPRIEGWLRAYIEWSSGEGERFTRAKNEVVLWNETLRVAGKADKIAVDKFYGPRAVVEFKSGEPEDWHALQVEAYRVAARKPGEQMLTAYLVYLRKTGKYSMRAVKPAPGRWAAVVSTFNEARARHLKLLQKIKDEEVEA